MADKKLEKEARKQLCKTIDKLYIPVNKLTIEHLPPKFQDRDIFEFIKATADVTVKIQTDSAKCSRELAPIQSGSSSTSTSRTGNVFEITQVDAECPCSKCKDSIVPKRIWWRIQVSSAAHGLGDPREETSDVFFFYDDEFDRSKVAAVRGAVLHEANKEYDWCVFHCGTCDAYLAAQLIRMLEFYDDVRRAVWNKYRTCRNTMNWAFMVSHPHGWPKMVGFGPVIEKKNDQKYQSIITYLLPTCAGSSGAHVHYIGYYGRPGIPHPVHSGSVLKYNDNGEELS